MMEILVGSLALIYYIATIDSPGRTQHYKIDLHCAQEDNPPTFSQLLR